LKERFSLLLIFSDPLELTPTLAAMNLPPCTLFGLRRNTFSSEGSRQSKTRTVNLSPYDTNDAAQLARLRSDDGDELLEIFSRAAEQSNNGAGVWLPPPASSSAIARLPKSHVLPCHREQFKHDVTSCSICCDPLLKGTPMLVRLPCGHIFHIK